MNSREQRVQESAYYLWEEEGRPNGRDEIHWQMAEIAVALMDCLDDIQQKRKAPCLAQPRRPHDPA
jgi:hypothetical protein